MENTNDEAPLAAVATFKSFVKRVRALLEPVLTAPSMPVGVSDRGSSGGSRSARAR